MPGERAATTSSPLATPLRSAEGVRPKSTQNEPPSDIVVAWGVTWTTLGRFDDEIQAAIVYDRAARRLRGRNARLNFDPKTGAKTDGRPAGSLSR